LLKGTIDNGNGTSSDHFQFVVSRDGDQVVINSQTVVQRGVWYHVAATYDGNQSVLYVNGVAEASATAGFALDYDTTPLFIGTTGTWAPYLNMFGGIIDEVSIYNRVLSVGEIAAIYNAGSNGKCASTPPPPGCDPPPSGLVSWWRGEDNANDTSGTNNGTLSSSGASYAAGMVGQAFRFDGTNGYVQVPDSATLKPANVTVEAWVWLDPSLPSTNGGEQIVFKKNTWSAWFEGYSLLKGTIDNGNGTSSDHFQFVVSRDGDQVVINSQTVVQRGVWYHVAATYDGNQSILYVNGVAEASATAGFALDYDTTPLFIGTTGTWAPYLNMFGGIIDEVSIYNRALSADEIAAIYNAGSSGKCVSTPPPPGCDPPPAGLVSWWRGEGNASDTIGTNNGTLSSSGASYAAGMVGQAFRFDGTNGYVQVPDSATLKPANVTVEAWVWLDPSLPSTNGGEQIVFKKNTWSAWFEGYSLLKGTIDNGNGTSSDHFQFVVSRDGDQVVINSQTVVQRGVWYHVAATYDGNQSVLYVNGVAEASATAGFALDYDTTPLFIGTTGTWSPYLNMFGGIIDEVSIYNRALSVGEIAAIYSAGSNGKCVSTPPPPPPLPDCDPAPSGLVSWWRGEDNANDTTGTNNGTLSSSGASYAPGMVGQAFRFDGTNGYVQIPDSSTLKPANVTVEAWVWLDPNLPSNNGEQIVFKKNTWSAWFEGYSLSKQTIDNGNGTSSNHFQFVVSRDGDQVVINSQTIAQRGVWYHVAATYDGNQSVLYVNGVAEASATAGFALDYDTTPLFIGTTGTWAPYLNMFGGIIDEVSICNRALSAGEIAAIYNAGSNGKCVPHIRCMPDSIATATNTPVSFAAARLTINDIDLDGYTLTVAAVVPLSANGGTNTLVSGIVTYNPPPNFAGVDSFLYTVSDGHGGSASGTVTVNVGPVQGPSQNLLFSPRLIGGHLVFEFAGVPGMTYIIESSPGLNGPWSKVTNLTAPLTDQGSGEGVLQIQMSAAPGMQFYRAVCRPY
ncbi:MAG TPA: LamG-like jellyroll fold domain-containing protein, partial [Verrucomicrobiae bacterium]|nr:LamG-like jellyroll fold domain-containing protein [Verrucomicrobiae bacterium]